MSYLASRMGCIDASGIRKVFALAAQMKDPVNLSIGQPDYDVDEAVKETAISAIRSGHNTYTQTWGNQDLRDAVIGYYQRRFDVTPQNIMITSGVTGGLFLALMATINPGDEAIFADPYFVMYPHLVNLLGGKGVPVDTYPDFKLTPERIEPHITPKTKMIIVNAPSNPTGVTLNADELRAIADLARKHNLLVLTDEIYEALLYDDAPATMVGMYDNVMLLNGLSKSAGMTGWRVGFAAGPEDIIQAMNTLQQYSFVCAPAPAQKASVTALGQDIEKHLADYREKRDIIYNGLKDTFHISTRPGGAFYIFPEAPGGDGDAFVAEAIRNNLLIIPGSVFSKRKTNFRISFAAKNETLHKGIDILTRLAKEFS
ncbi:MAG: aminotransferase class I/II-fold pyridoxal phosphate-dependent enzyme [Candidatus Hydrogenedens sp.]|nr:aminotransferase class I/II-fold pyridoxal phosphate-dependent enzyme [Candidatus Hydrogenedens sp.]